MRYATLATIGLGLALASTSARAQSPAPGGGPELKTSEQKIAYSLGVNLGRNMKAEGLDVDPNIIAQGLRDGLSDKSALTDAQMAEVMEVFKQQMMAKQREMMAKQQGGGGAAPNSALADKSLKAGQAFLAENKTKQGVTTLPSGVQYKVLKQGTGKTPKITDTVLANYRGTLIDGTEFDSSYKRGEPAEFPVNRVIKGWTEILQQMKVGDKYMVYIPTNMAYALNPPTPAIPPNSALVFEIELMDIPPSR